MELLPDGRSVQGPWMIHLAGVDSCKSRHLWASRSHRMRNARDVGIYAAASPESEHERVALRQRRLDKPNARHVPPACVARRGIV